MSLRAIDSTATAVTQRKTLQRVVISQDGIQAIWRVPLAKGGFTEVSVEVSRSVVTNIMARVTLQAVLDAIKDDSYPKAVAP